MSAESRVVAIFVNNYGRFKFLLSAVGGTVVISGGGESLQISLQETNFISTPKSYNALEPTTFFITHSSSFHNVPKLVEDFLE
jgi:hypothetical protein